MSTPSPQVPPEPVHPPSAEEREDVDPGGDGGSAPPMPADDAPAAYAESDVDVD